MMDVIGDVSDPLSLSIIQHLSSDIDCSCCSAVQCSAVRLASVIATANYVRSTCVLYLSKHTQQGIYPIL